MTRKAPVVDKADYQAIMNLRNLVDEFGKAATDMVLEEQNYRLVDETEFFDLHQQRLEILAGAGESNTAAQAQAALLELMLANLALATISPALSRHVLEQTMPRALVSSENNVLCAKYKLNTIQSLILKL